MFKHPESLERSREGSLRTRAIGVAGLLQSLNGPPASFLRAFRVDLGTVFGGVGQNSHLVRQYLEESAADEELFNLAAGLDPQFAWNQ